MTTVETSHRPGCACPDCFNGRADVKEPATPTSELARQMTHVKLLLAGVLAAILLVGAGAFMLTRPEPDWDFGKCISASLSGSGYDRQDMVDHGCFD